MKQAMFHATHHRTWEEFRSLLDMLEASPRHVPQDQIRRFAPLYGQVCNHYAIAKERHYRDGLVAEIEALTHRAHRLMYRPRPCWRATMWRFFAYDFPRAIRAHAGTMLLSLALLVVPAVALCGLTYWQSESVYMVYSVNQVNEFEQMYGADREKLARERDADSDVLMFAFYIFNNVGIGFRTFASGMFLGIGTAIALVFNGVYLGTTAGYLTAAGHGERFWSFVIGHSAFELTAIVICGAAGLRLAQAVFAPAALPRREALRQFALQAAPLIIGAAVLFVVAAIIEAFWSPRQLIPPPLKYVTGGALWILLLAYFFRAGRTRGA